MITKIDLNTEISKIQSKILANQAFLNNLEYYKFVIDKLQNKYKNIEIYKLYNIYNIYADLTNCIEKKIYFKHFNTNLYYFIKLKDEEYNIDIFDIKTINEKNIINYSIWYDDDCNDCYSEHIIEINEDLEKLSNQFQNSNEILSIFKSKILEFIRLKPDDGELVFNSPESNNKIIENIKENLLFL